MDKDQLKIVASMASAVLWFVIIADLFGYANIDNFCMQMAGSSQSIGRLLIFLPYTKIFLTILFPVILIGAIKRN